MLKPGTIVGDKYRLERVLGRGGMGTVIEARHVQLGTPFALKFIHRSIAENATVPERFLREARAAAAIGSEHVCRVFDVGTHAATNPVASAFTGRGGIGSTTTVWDNVSSATNKARYYLIRCQ